jgi:ABC-type sugar transport systems, permease components
MVGRNQGRLAFFFLAPYILVFVLFRFGPSVAGLGLSFFKWGIVGNPAWRGLANYSRLARDPMFGVALLNTLLFLLYTVPLLLVGSLLIAALLNQSLRFRNALRAIVIIPYILIPAVVGVIWNWLYDTNFGILNYYLKCLGIRPVEWLTSQSWALASVSIVTIWSYVGYDIVLFLAGLQGIPTELYEAARMDGASSRVVFFRITLPLLKPITSMVLTMTIINAIQVFDQIFVMTNGGPGTATLTLVQYLYGTAFQNFNLGYGATISTAMLALLVVIVSVQSRLFREKA